MRALITGGGGSIGSRLVAALDARGDRVAVLDVSAEPEVRSDAFDRAEVHVGEIQDPRFVNDVVAGYRPDAIFHLAAILSGRAEEQPDLAWRVNVDGTRNVLEAARRNGVERVMFTSTIATFGSGVTDPATDDTPQWPAGLYGVSKVACERLGAYYHQRFGLDFRGVRLSAMVAPSAPRGGAASAFVCEMYVEAVRRGMYTAYVYPTTVVPVIWVEDVVRALMQLNDAPGDRLRRRVYTIVGAASSVTDMAAAISRRLPNVEIEFEPDPVRADIVDSWPSAIDDSDASADWGWEPRFDLESMTDANLAELRARFVARGS